MGESTIRRTPSYLMARAHFYRDRGASHVDGFRTSFQAAVLMAGVMFGAKFTEDPGRAWAWGLAVFVIMEGAKLAWGWADWRYRVTHQQAVASNIETNPVTMYQTELLEIIAYNGTRDQQVAAQEIAARRHSLGLPAR